ncbi:MAG: hypothetical protein PHW96_03305 [Candidatus Nanoarchaeia archaeon]|nr:hypothetical protein [Candidatus Nanoarchaeia archaeon]
MTTIANYNALFVISAVTLGVVLSLWVGMRFMIRIDRNMSKAMDKLTRLESQQLKVENKILKLEMKKNKQPKKPAKKKKRR